MSRTALYVVGQKRFVATMRKAGADMKQLKEVNRKAAAVALPAVQALTPHGSTGRLAGSVRVGATQKAGVIRAGRKTRASSTTAGQHATSKAASSSTTGSRPPNHSGHASTSSSSTRH